MCKGRDASALAKELVKRGLLVPDANGKTSRPEKVRGQRKTRYYVLKSAILDDGADA